MKDWTSRTNKATIARPIVWKSKRRFNNILTLPSGPCEDIKFGIQCGTVTPSTRVIAIEREDEPYLMMHDTLSRLPIKSIPIYADLATVVDLPLLDMVNLDYQGNMRKVDVLWFRDTLLSHLTPNANVFITGYPAIRGNRFCADLLDELHNKHEQFFQKVIYYQLSDLPTLASREVACMTYLLTRLYLMKGYRAKYQMTTYNDGTPMLLLSVCNIRDGEVEHNDPNYNAVHDTIQSVLDSVPEEPTNTIDRHARIPQEISLQQHFRNISEELAHAQTDEQFRLVHRKMNHAAALGAMEGKNPTMVIAGFKAAATRIQQGESI